MGTCCSTRCFKSFDVARIRFFAGLRLGFVFKVAATPGSLSFAGLYDNRLTVRRLHGQMQRLQPGITGDKRKNNSPESRATNERTTAMKITVSESLFIDRFCDYGRQDQFSVMGLRALFEYLDDLDEQCGTETELDVIAICCDFAEAGSAIKWCADFGYDVPGIDDCDDDDEREELALEFLQENTMVVAFDGGVIAAAF